MLVTPYPGANRDDVLRTLRDIQSAAQDAGNAHGPAHNRLTAYLEWATSSVRMLEHRVSTSDIDRLVLTRGYLRPVQRPRDPAVPGLRLVGHLERRHSWC
jgi:hypothetical protein